MEGWLQRAVPIHGRPLSLSPTHLETGQYLVMLQGRCGNVVIRLLRSWVLQTAGMPWSLMLQPALGQPTNVSLLFALKQDPAVLPLALDPAQHQVLGNQ